MFSIVVVTLIHFFFVEPFLEVNQLVARCCFISCLLLDVFLAPPWRKQVTSIPSRVSTATRPRGRLRRAMATPCCGEMPEMSRGLGLADSYAISWILWVFGHNMKKQTLSATVLWLFAFCDLLVLHDVAARRSVQVCHLDCWVIFLEKGYQHILWPLVKLCPSSIYCHLKISLSHTARTEKYLSNFNVTAFSDLFGFSWWIQNLARDSGHTAPFRRSGAFSVWCVISSG